MNELGFVHQHRTFHLKKHKIQHGKENKWRYADYRLELKNTHPDYSEDEINEIIKRGRLKIIFLNKGVRQN